MKPEWKLLYYVGKWASCVMLCFVVIVDVVVGLLLIVLSRVESRGCYMYRGDAAQIFIEQYWLRLEIVSLMNSNW